jgi:hemerythrin-like domain-containing protein
MQRRIVRRTHRMQRPTDDLRTDHGLARRGLRVLAAIADWVAAGKAFPVADSASVLRFLREWVIAVHMRKEDEVLGPAVAMRADEDAAAVVGTLMRLHEEISELSHSLVMFWEPMGDLTAAERSGFCETVNALIHRVERRQELEEENLFPACDSYVPADDQLGWRDQFAALEDTRGSREVWTRRIDALSSRWIDGID